VTVNDTPVPVIFASSPAFGIHPCGNDVTGATWGNANCTTATSSGTCKYANPSISKYYSLAADSTGPVDSSANTAGVTTVEYGAMSSSAVPPGLYRNTITYVATATF
jgi:hypothetical protein